MNYEKHYAEKFAEITDEIDGTITCTQCRFCQVNLKIEDRVDGYDCYHKDNMQYHLHGKQAMSVDDTFLCNRFSLYIDKE